MHERRVLYTVDQLFAGFRLVLPVPLARRAMVSWLCFFGDHVTGRDITLRGPHEPFLDEDIDEPDEEFWSETSDTAMTESTVVSVPAVSGPGSLGEEEGGSVPESLKPLIAEFASEPIAPVLPDEVRGLFVRFTPMHHILAAIADDDVRRRLAGDADLETLPADPAYRDRFLRDLRSMLTGIDLKTGP